MSKQNQVQKTLDYRPIISIHISLALTTGPAEGGVPGVHVHPLFFGRTPRDLQKN